MLLRYGDAARGHKWHGEIGAAAETPRVLQAIPLYHSSGNTFCAHYSSATLELGGPSC